ncbi:PREDICTED: UDP-glucuronosyltransferase 1-10-like [Dinoponera quadriceps]|uniref:UDP-glucuronosyltransferase n=1 Tax=Dinoponera quadriceps TaxID=609295 RepID=A0A6P3Y5Q2_DINQU|nr:PREDICTED: UDP-glucuronosyltransferase 1-10-like [Dinoponera quadriceps]XP_014485663.1 PREDICTED: UDP-glucuronosyltransferase 1-10-like [Dinoponera quadriceps]
MRLLSVMVPWLLCLSTCDSYRFLGVFPFHGKSHFVMFEALLKGLARKGHQVDVISTFPLKKPYPNYNDIVKLQAPMQLMNNLTYEMMNKLITSDVVNAVATMGGNNLCEYLGKPEILELVRNPPKDPPYDAVLLEVFGAHCFAIIGHLWNVPIIGVSTTSLYPWLHWFVAQPENIAFVPNNCIGYVGYMNFWQRVHNVLHTSYAKWSFFSKTSVQDDIIKKYFGPGMPSVRELEKKVSIILMNSHISLNGVKPTTPAVVDVGGLHIYDEGSTLRPELEKWMNDSKHGFIYFTFGSMVMIETFPDQFLKVLYTSLGKIAPVRVLMKVPRPEKLPSNLPTNIQTFRWLSQLKVLKHPNIKVFITHGGLMGTQEAIACGVPMIGIPLFADQFANIDSYVAHNIAVRVNIKGITEEILDKALNAVLWDPLYRESARNLSRRFLDRPMNGLDTAIFWIEYVLKYGSDVLRSPALILPWWQLYLLDVIGLFVICAIVVIIVVKFVVCFVLEMINGGLVSSSQSKKID